MTEDQKAFFEKFFSGSNICITGSAGTGKSFCIKSLFNFLQKEAKVSVGKTATTGVAAFNIEGSTIHSWAGIGLGDEDALSLIKFVGRNKKAKERITGCSVLILDEVSMMSASLLNKLDIVFKYYRYNNEPFGGLQIIFSGDFLQLPPVFKSAEDNMGFAFDSRAWKEANISVVNLKQIMRQAGDTSFTNLLNEIRVGNTDSLPLLKSRIDAKFPNDEIKPVKIFCKNIDVNEFNKKKLNEINKPVRIFTALDSGDERFIKHFDKNCPAPKELFLKEGAQVMLLKNIDTENGLVNGSVGVIESFSTSGVVVKFCSGKIGIIDLDEWHIKEQTIGFDKKITYRVVATRKQVPLKLAYSVTVHRSQGLTLDRAELDLNEAFACGQSYVALSRVRNLESLSVKEFAPQRVMVNKQCLDFYKDIDKK